MEKEKLLLTLILFFACLPTCVGQEQDHETYARQVAKHLDLEEFQKLSKDLDIALQKLPAQGKGCKDCGAQVQNLESIKSDDKNGILIFVSFSMPKATLVELNNQSKKYKARLILRGLYRNSFAKMKDKILKIEPNGLTFDIDPQLFKKYKVERVPTFILLKNGQEINRLTGNVTLEFAHRKLNGESR